MWMTLSEPPHLGNGFLGMQHGTQSLADAVPVVVAVPACNEAQSIAPCLAALDAAAAAAGHRADVTVLVLANNCRDATAATARRFFAGNLRIIVDEIQLPAGLAHAGVARREALDRAAARLPAHGVLMTTDADSVVAPGWISANLAALANADAVAGVVAFDSATRKALPRLPGRDLEWRLAELQARLGCLLDPRPHDPWPNHIWAWGASLALTLAAYRTVGGLPVVTLAEDRALAAELERADLRVRRSHAPVVYTSARFDGRAPGGFADLLRSYAFHPGVPCDAAIEPTAVLFRRLRWRVKLRRIHDGEGPVAAAEAARPLAGQVPPLAGFGAFWASVEALAPTLRRHRVLPARLPAEVARAERLIRACEARRAGTPLSALAA